MADKRIRVPESAPGKYYVDRSCIASKFCVEVASKNFRMVNRDYATVVKQPDTPEEEEACRKALSGCPVEAIGNDGD